MDGAAPFYYPAGQVGCLVLHSFTGTPQEVRWLGQHLHRQGYTVYGPRLAGHGTRPADLRRINWQEWLADARAGYQLLRATCDAVFVLGLSMGGVLGLMLAADEDVAGVVGMSTPHIIYRAWRRPFLKLAGAAGVSLHKPNGRRLNEIVLAEQQARGERPTGHITYPEYPARAADQLWSLMETMPPLLPRVSAPALLIHSPKDNVVPLNQLRLTLDALGSADKRSLILSESRHMLSEDVERAAVFKAASDFIARVSPADR
jgi:carboxylesterase